ncbi:hypothetical protein MIMGU_mgv1a018739mg, partial [Erythranthe guttata]
GRKKSGKGKGKMKEVAEQQPLNLFTDLLGGGGAGNNFASPINGHHFASPINGASRSHFASPFNGASGYQFTSPASGYQFASPINGASEQYSSQLQQILNGTAAPYNSFTALLAAAATQDEDHHTHTDFSADVENHALEIDRLITSHRENLRYALAGTRGGAAEEGAAVKKLKVKELELDAKVKQVADLEKTAEHYQAESDQLRETVWALKEEIRSLRSCLRDVIAARRYAETAEEDAQSSCVDPSRVAPVTLDCKTCRRRPATVMVWPCRHISVCTVCDTATRSCPSCRKLKTTSIEVRLPKT